MQNKQTQLKIYTGKAAHDNDNDMIITVHSSVDEPQPDYELLAAHTVG